MQGRGGQAVPIDVLPDDILLAIFDFCAVDDGNSLEKITIEAWQSLVHVCRRWRCVVFGSPRRLNLRLVCTHRTRARETLDVWPALPLIVQSTIYLTSVDNIVVALGHRDRICQIDLRLIRSLEWDKVLAAMQVPFPALKHLTFQCIGEMIPIPDTFLGGSAPLLRSLAFCGIPFPGILNLLWSATHLVELYLIDIPHSGYISPEAMATCLSMLTSLRHLSLSLSLGFLYTRSRRHPPPTTCSILPNLNRFSFRGASKYLDDLVALVDAPLLDYLTINFPYQSNFDAPHLVQFISRMPRLKEPNEAHVSFDLDGEDFDAEIQLLRPSGDEGFLRVEIICEESHTLVSSIAQVCNTCLPQFPMVEVLRLEVENPYSELDWKDDVENDEWLELLRPFPAVKSFYLSEELRPDLASALQELAGGRTMEVLPSLQNIFLESFQQSEPFQEAIGQFLTARQLSGHTVAVLPLQDCDN